MARFVPRTLRGQRPEPGSDEPATPEAQGTGTPARRPSPRRAAPKPGAGGKPASQTEAAAVDADVEDTLNDDADVEDTVAEVAEDAPDDAAAGPAEAELSDDASESDGAPEASDEAPVADEDEVSEAAAGKPKQRSDGGKTGAESRTGSKSRAGSTRQAARGKRSDGGTGGGRTRAGGRKVVAAPRTGSNRRAKLAQAAIGRLRRTAVSLVVWLVVFGALAGVAGYFYSRGQATDRAGEEALTAAKSAAEAIFSYDYRSFDESVANGRQHVSGKFKAEYAKTTAGLAKTAKKEKAIMRARVSTAGVVEASPDRVDVLLFVNQYRRNANITGEKVDENRVVLTMVHVEEGSGSGVWLVSNAVAY